MELNKNQTSGNMDGKTTILAHTKDSCMACWNKELTADKAPMAPRAHGIVVSMPVHLIEREGNIILLCYTARCMECGYTKRYGVLPGIYKLSGNKPDFGIQFWPEIKRNNIDPDKFIEEVLNTERGRPVWVDAKDVQYASQERAPFYEQTSREVAYAG